MYSCPVIKPKTSICPSFGCLIVFRHVFPIVGTEPGSNMHNKEEDGIFHFDDTTNTMHTMLRRFKIKQLCHSCYSMRTFLLSVVFLSSPQLTSVPIMVGRRYNEHPSSCGTQSFSVSTNLCKHSLISSVSKLGRHIRDAELFILSKLHVGLKSLIFPSSPQ